MFPGDSWMIARVVLAPAAGALIVSLLLTAITRRICVHKGWVARPRKDRWHKSPTSLFGGIPIWLSFALVVGFSYRQFSSEYRWLIGMSSLMFVVGFWDDIFQLRARGKLFWQTVASALVLLSGLLSPLPKPTLLWAGLFLIWMIGLTNAFNLLDNMDGLAAGIAVISALCLAFVRLFAGDMPGCALMLMFAGSVSGFLVFNRNPASIFMGDAGSLFLGFFLGTASLVHVGVSSSIGHRTVVALLVMAIPIFDVIFVSVARRLRGQPVSQGGTDHSSHRLVRRGLSEYQTVALLCAISAITGLIALVGNVMTIRRAVALTGVVWLTLLVFGIELFKPDRNLSRGDYAAFAFLRALFNRDRISLWLDPAILAFAAFLSFRAIPHTPASWDIFFYCATLLVVLKLVFLWSYGGNRALWWRTSVRATSRVLLALIIGELLAFTVLGILNLDAFWKPVILDLPISALLLMFFRRSPYLCEAFLTLLRKPQVESLEMKLAAEIAVSREVYEDRTALMHEPISVTDTTAEVSL